MVVCPISKYLILQRLKIIKYVQHKVASDRHVLQWKHKAKRAGLLFLFTCVTEPFVAFVLLICDQSAVRPATLTKLTSALLILHRVFFL